MTRVAVMQPYFLPYAGYFRLFAATDRLVFLDSVQFPRRGYVHRNRLPDSGGKPQWLTLPLRAETREVLIRDLVFRDDAASEWLDQWRRFPALDDPDNRRHPLAVAAARLAGTPVEYLIELLRLACDQLELPFATSRASDIAVDPGLHGEDRIIAIVRAVGGTIYVNPPGGKALYDPARFAAEGIELRFLEDYRGPAWSMLHRLLTEKAAALRGEILGQCAQARP